METATRTTWRLESNRPDSEGVADMTRRDETEKVEGGTMQPGRSIADVGGILMSQVRICKRGK